MFVSEMAIAVLSVVSPVQVDMRCLLSSVSGLMVDGLGQIINNQHTTLLHYRTQFLTTTASGAPPPFEGAVTNLHNNILTHTAGFALLVRLLRITSNKYVLLYNQFWI